MHITAAVYVNDDEGGLIADIDDWLERLAPHEPVSGYRHNRGEDNADAHLKRQLMAHQVVLADHRRQARPRPVGAGLLRRVRRPPAQARRAQGDRRVSSEAEAIAAAEALELLDWKRRVFALYADAARAA